MCLPAVSTARLFVFRTPLRFSSGLFQRFSDRWILHSEQSSSRFIRRFGLAVRAADCVIRKLVSSRHFRRLRLAVWTARLLQLI
ncbi:unnamed protein product [Cochlearia groenlandica]